MNSAAVEDLFGANFDIVLAHAERVLDGLSAVGIPDPHLHEGARLLGGYPNPFNPATTIRFTIPEAGHVTVRIRDVMGRQIRSLLDRTVPAGLHAAEWDGRDEQGNVVGTGVYLGEMEFGDERHSVKLTLMK